MKYKATKAFKRLGIENSYQGLTVREYFALREGKTVELISPPSDLIVLNYIELVKSQKPTTKKT